MLGRSERGSFHARYRLFPWRPGRRRSYHGGPRRCAGDARVALARATTTVEVLEARELALMSQLAHQGDSAESVSNATPDGDYRPREASVAFTDKTSRLEDIRAEIDSAVENLGTAPRWRQWLQFTERFHKYSLNNQLLIAMQKPTPVGICASPAPASPPSMAANTAPSATASASTPIAATGRRVAWPPLCGWKNSRRGAREWPQAPLHSLAMALWRPCLAAEQAQGAGCHCEVVFPLSLLLRKK